MARGKPKREKAAIPASYIRPRELPNGRTSYNVRAYYPATRTCKTLGTFKTKRAAERAFKKGAELSSRTRAPSHRRTSRPPRAPSWTTPAPSRASRRSARARPSPARPPASAGARLPPRRSARPSTRGAGRRKTRKTKPTRRRRPRRPRAAQKQAPRLAVFRTLASAAAAVSPFANLDVQDVQERREPNMNRRASGSPEGASESSRRGAVARTFSTPAATPPPDAVAAAPVSGVYGRRGRVEPHLRVRTRGGVPRPRPRALGRRAQRTRGSPRRRRPRRPGRADSPGPAERLAAFLDPPCGGCAAAAPPPPGSRDAPRALRSRRGA